MGETATDSKDVGRAAQLTIQREVAVRAQVHQGRVAASKQATAANAAPGPLAFLAHGDSWFDYPLIDNGPLLGDTDIVHQLRKMGNIHPLILNVSHYGDSTVDEMSLPKQQRLIENLNEPSNWLGSGKPDAILFSGGGNDIAGDQFLIYLRSKGSPSGDGLAIDRFEKMLDGIGASYLDLLAFRDAHAPNVPIFAHGYDFAIPDGDHPICAGPWLKPSVTFAGYNVAEGRAIVRNGLERFKARLQALANNPANNFILVDTQGTLADDEWANELHPTESGFVKVADRFLAALRAKFGNDRI